MRLGNLPMFSEGARQAVHRVERDRVVGAEPVPSEAHSVLLDGHCGPEGALSAEQRAAPEEKVDG